MLSWFGARRAPNQGHNHIRYLMLAQIKNYLGLAAAYTRLNLNAQLEYRGAFISQVAAMFLNDGVWVIFWTLFFTRFPVLRGWNIDDIITVW
jgi:ABC-2 type transport system permease protein